MKIIKTTLGWEIQPSGEQEMAHVRWLLDCLGTRPAPIPVVVNDNLSEGTIAIVADQILQQAARAISCPRCYNFGCYNGSKCNWCGYGLIRTEPESSKSDVLTFTTKGPVE